ncbi:MAG: hypothetical protein ACRENB_05640 [Gemmatimonadales bacterium]
MSRDWTRYVTAILGLCSCLTGCRRPLSTDAFGAGRESSCPVETRTSTPLVLSGNRRIYVEPMALAVRDETVLMTGVPTYLWGPQARTMPRDRGVDTLVGLFRDARGRVTALRKPEVLGGVSDFRIDAGAGDDMAVFFSQLDRPFRPGEPVTTVDFWYGIIARRKWASLERLPRPRSGVLETYFATSPARSGHRLLLAVPIRNRSTDVGVYTRDDGRWTLDVVPTGRAAYVALSAIPAGDILLVVVRPDTTRTSDQNSLSLLVRRNGEWTDLGFAVLGGPEPIHEPRFFTVAGVQLLSWLVESEITGSRAVRVARVMPGPRLGPVVTLAEGIEYVSFVTGSAAPLWVVSTPATSTSPGHLRLVSWNDGTPARVVDVVTNPFTGYFTALASRKGAEVLGPLRGRDTTDAPVVLSSLHTRFRCDA